MIKKLTSVMLAILIGFMPVLQTEAAKDKKVDGQEGTVGFTVKAQIPKNQIDKEKTYFDLKVKPGSEQELKVEVYNYTGETASFKADVVFATTNHLGEIEYSKTDVKKADKSMKYPLPKIATLKEDEETMSEGALTLENGKSGILAIELKVPDEKIDGIILGGIKINRVKSDQEVLEEEEKNGVVIENEYSYVIGTQLRMNDKEVIPNLNFNNVKPTLINGRTAVVVNLQNDKSTSINKLKVDGEILKDGKVIRENYEKNFKIAPNVNFDFPFMWENEEIKPGDYSLKLKATDGDQTWKWEEDFTISEDALELNNKAVYDQKSKAWIYILIAALVAIIIGGLIILFISKRKNRIQ